MPIARPARSCAAAAAGRSPPTTSRGPRNDGRRAERRPGSADQRGKRPMSGNVIETVMGAVVLVIAALFLFFAYSTSKVGAVTAESLDPKTYVATLRMNIKSEYKLPDDTVAEITSSSLLGDKYVSLVPGGSEKDIPPGGQIKYTQSSVSL